MTSPIIVALDFDDMCACEALLEQLSPELCRLKIGLGMFVRFGHEFVSTLVQRGFDVFLDLKFHDIPHQVGLACRMAADLGVWMMNVHACGGPAMMSAAREAVASGGPILLAVTVLTSMSQTEFSDIINDKPIAAQVSQLAQMTQQCGLDGVVCSALEVANLRQQLGQEFCLVTPGIRLTKTSNDDQTRIMTPADALAAGSNYLVIGRPITQSKEPVKVLQQILELC